MPGPSGDPPPTPADERAAMRAFLQRSEVRLSTLHRVASALLSGAGITVLLPVVARDALTQVVRTVAAGRLDGARVLLLVATAVAVLLPVAALWVLLKELTRFYFHAEHHGHGGADLFLPRYTLSALRLPADELSGERYDELARLRRDPFLTGLLVPDNERFRARIDRQRDHYRAVVRTEGEGDEPRVELLVALAASRERSLAAEVVKVEYGMARHVLRTQVLVLRYVKALLVLVTTAAATFAAAAAIEGDAAPAVLDLQWTAAILAVWAPVVVYAVTSPVHWLERILKRDGASAQLVRGDREFTHFEDVAVRLALVGWLAAVAGIGWLAGEPDATAPGVPLTLAVAVASGAGLVAALSRWGGRRTLARLAGRH